MGSAWRFRNRLTSVVWTKIDREVVEYARANPDEEYYRGKDLVELRSELAWATEHGINLQDWREHFKAENPPELVKEMLAAFAQLWGPGYAGESDAIRLFTHRRFGGAYADGDDYLGIWLMGDLQSVLNSPYGFMLEFKRATQVVRGRVRHGYLRSNALIIGPAGHAIGYDLERGMAQRYARLQEEDTHRTDRGLPGRPEPAQLRRRPQQRPAALRHRDPRHHVSVPRQAHRYQCEPGHGIRRRSPG